MNKTPGANEPCWCGSGKKYKKCHREQDAESERAPRAGSVRPGVVSPRRAVPAEIVTPNYVQTGRPRPVPRMDDAAERLSRMRRTCSAAAQVLFEAGARVAAGVTTDELDELVHKACIARGAYPSPLNYRGFPKSLCTSVNEVILHGIPDSRALSAGDIVNLDITTFLDGFHGDCSATFAVGAIDGESERLVRVTREAMWKGIEAVRPGRPLSDIGRAIEDYASKHGYGVVRMYCGHGIGEEFHLNPQIFHYFEPSATQLMQEGMFFTIEPMLTQGTPEHVVWPDGWTAVTADGKRAAQFEHTVYVTRDGAEVLTLGPGEKA